MRTWEDYETTPNDEPCECLGENYDETKARNEARRTIGLIHQMLGLPPQGSSLSIKGNPHDFGTYLSIRYTYDDDDLNHDVYATALDQNFPDTWEGTPAVILEYPDGEIQEYPDAPPPQVPTYAEVMTATDSPYEFTENVNPDPHAETVKQFAEIARRHTGENQI